MTPSLPPVTRTIQSIPGWPSPEEAHDVLEIVVLNIGISQQLFDVRAFADNMHLFFDEPTPQQSSLNTMEALLIFAIGRLLQARPDDGPKLPGSALYDEAMRLLPPLPELRRSGPLAIGVLGLAAFYLQMTDRKEDAYTYVRTLHIDWTFVPSNPYSQIIRPQSSIALRLAITHNMHRMTGFSKPRRSAAIHQNRLWWTIYMQERWKYAFTISFPSLEC